MRQSIYSVITVLNLSFVVISAEKPSFVFFRVYFEVVYRVILITEPEKL